MDFFRAFFFLEFYTRSYPLHYFLILILEKEPVQANKTK